MNESDARQALLVRSFETASPPPASWTAEDRDWATRAAAEVEGEDVLHHAFVATRARLAAERLCGRDRNIARALAAATWRPWVGWALAALAIALGVATDAIGAGQRINVLVPPLLALMAWNLLVYASIAARALARAFGDRRGKPIDGPLSRWLARVAHLANGSGASRATGAEAQALTRFATEWMRAGAPLNARRLSRLLHLAAIAFALGALSGLYLRGLAFEYRAGWESTFLNAPSLRSILQVVLAPASALTGIPLPDEARLEAMRFPGSEGERAGPWIHLYAVTVALVVLLPRAALALFDFVRERRLATDFPVPLDEAYFAALGRAHRGEAAPVVVLPYNHRPGGDAAGRLERLLGPLVGSGLALNLLPAVGYGDEDDAGKAVAGRAPLALAVALLSSTATPEQEAHGRFVESMAAGLPPGTPLLVLVDESAFVARFGDDPTARRRRDERRQAWTRLLAEDERRAVFVDLQAGDVSLPAQQLREAIVRTAPMRSAR